MKITRKHSNDERRILTAMIVDPIVCAKITAKWQHSGLFNSKWSNMIANWCVRYYNKYERPPQKHIENLYESWACKTNDKETVKLIEKFLGHLSDDYIKQQKESNSNYIIDLAGKHFNKTKLKRLINTIEGELELDQIESANELVIDFNAIELGKGEGIKALRDKNAIKEAFTSKTEPLVKYPGALGSFFKDALERDAFIAFMGPEKRGKCVSANMEVLMEDGTIQTIENIVNQKIKKRVVTYNEHTHRFQFMPIKEYWYNGKKDCVKVKTRTGRTVETTNNHQYYTPTGWKYLNDIKTGDFIAVPKKLDVFGKKKIKKEEIKFIAYMLAEGGCTGTQMTFTNTDNIITKDFKNICSKLDIQYKKSKITYLLRGQANNVCRKYKMFGHSAKTKQIPEEIFTLPKKDLSLFLRLFFSCDGTIYKDNGRYIISIGLANEIMLKQIQHILIRFGIVAKMRYKNSRCNGHIFPSWILSICDSDNINKFLEYINFISYKKTKPLQNTPKKSFLDKLPNTVAGRFYQELQEEVKEPEHTYHIGKGKYYRPASGIRKLMGKKEHGTINHQINKGCSLMRQSFDKAKKTKAYSKYLNDDILWDEVLNIEKVGKKQTYDLSIPKHHNFVCNDIVVHNTWWLMDVAFRGIMQKRKVAFFEAGDMSQNQFMRRLLCRISKRPLKRSLVQYPTDITKGPKDNMAQVEVNTLRFRKKLSYKKALISCKRFIKTKLKSKRTYFRLACHPNSTLSVRTIKNTLQVWERDGWVPDIVVVDYMDILDMSHPSLEGRDRINEVWKQMRGISQIYHCLVVTATQADAQSYKAGTLSRTHFSEDKRKFAHVTGMIGLNQKDEEKERGIMRLNWVALREGEYSERDCVHVATCLSLGNPAVISCK